MITVPMAPTAWRIQFSSGLPNRALPDPPGWKFNFPPDGHVNYVTAHILKDISAAKQIEISGNIDGPGPFTPVGGDSPPATFSLYFQRQGDDGTGVGAMEDYRWWYSEKFTITTPTVFSIIAPFDPHLWSCVYGKKASDHFDGFRGAMRHCANIGMTFGGHSFAGHGVRGNGIFHCRSYKVE